MFFENSLFGALNYEVLNGDPWFRAGDVYAALDLDKSVIRRIDDDDKMSISTTLKNGGHRKMVYISEAGVYQMIFASRSAVAKEFKRWLCHVVLPSIRKNGGYIIGQENMDEAELKELTAKVSQLAEEVASLTAGKEKVTTYLTKSDDIIAQMGKTVRHLLSVLAEHGIDPNPAKKKAVAPDDPRVITKGGLLMRRSEALAAGELFSLAP